ncbi:MAG: hypothetical protein ABIL09_07305 [Gemmatimonadota bacterium]
MSASAEMTLANDFAAWHWGWEGGCLRALRLENRRSGRTFALCGAREVACRLSAAADRLAEPVVEVADFAVVAVEEGGTEAAAFRLHSPATGLEARLHYQLDGPTRRKWVELTSPRDLLLLEVDLDDLGIEAELSGGEPGQPVLVAGELFAAMEHPAGLNRGLAGRLRLSHCPGRRLGPGQVCRSQTALVSAAPAGRALEHFVEYIQERAVRQPGLVSVYTPFGINNQWGACPALDDEQTLDVLRVLEGWQRRGARFDYFTLDSGWVDPSSDLTRFRPNAYPHGPGQIAARVEELGMRLGLWFATSWGTQSCWDYPPAYEDAAPPGLPYREGYPLTLGGITFCLAWEPYRRLLHDAVLHHIRQNGVRLLKFDGGSYRCDRTDHGHLPGPYSTERMYDILIELAASARAAAPDVFIMWYWGLRSPFWALHGDTIFESGLHMEGSGTSSHPALHYRDSVTLAQDQNARHARTIPPLVKDSLGVWLSDTRWGNFMGRERWREALVMDLGRANLLFPNLWGNVYHLDDGDVAFLARLTAVARRRQDLFLRRRQILGDPWRNEVYGYACCRGRRGLLFLHNAHFEARPARLCLDRELGLEGRAGAGLRVRSHFPERQQVLGEGGCGLRLGDPLELWLRPFEVLMLEVAPPGRGAALPPRAVTGEVAAGLGRSLRLEPAPMARDLEVAFADADRFRAQGLEPRSRAYAAALPQLGEPQPILAIAVRLRRGEEEWRHSPAVVEIVQAVVRVAGRGVTLVPVPDGRQYGNTQKAGCSWVVYKTRLSYEWSCQPLALAVHAHLPEGVEARVEAWIVNRWWEEDARPVADGYYTYAPS